MRALKACTYLALSTMALGIGMVPAQQPTPSMVVVQPAGAATAPTAAAVPAASPSSAVATAIKTLEQVKAANEATLKKQEAMLQQLDELQKAAEQLKVFSKRV